MAPKEKGDELFNMYMTIFVESEFSTEEYPELKFGTWSLKIKIAKQCALIAVDEIIKADPILPCDIYGKSALMYWNEVKQEIEKL